MLSKEEIVYSDVGGVVVRRDLEMHDASRREVWFQSDCRNGRAPEQPQRSSFVSADVMELRAGRAKRKAKQK